MASDSVSASRPSAVEPLLEVRGGAPLGVAAGGAPAEVDDGVELGQEIEAVPPSCS